MKIINIYIILALILSASLFGCARPEAQNGILIYALKSDPVSLNPVTASEFISQTVNSVIFSSLVKRGENMDIEPDLAESWESDESGKVWTFHLRKGVKWHDGAEFTADDVEFTFEKLFDPATNTFNRGLFMAGGKKPEVKAVGKYDIEIKLPCPFAPFISNLPSLGIIPKHLLEGKDINRDTFNWKPSGTGPFKFEEWRAGERICLKANKDYYGGAPRLKGIVFSIIPSPESRKIAVMTGCADMAEVTPEDLRELEKASNIRIHKWDQYLYCYMGFDLTNGLFKDAAVRKAINYSIDKEKIISAVFKGNAVRALGPIPPASPFYDKGSEPYLKNNKEALRLLEEAGWKRNSSGIMEKDGRKLSFDVIYPSGNAAFEKAAVFMQAQLKENGIDMRLKAMEFSALIDRCYPGKFEAVIFNWAETFDPDCFTEWHSSQAGDDGMNFVSYSNPETDRLLEKGRTVYKESERKKIYSELQRRLSADSPYVFLWDPKGIAAVSKSVKGACRPGPAGLLLNPEKIIVERSREQKDSQPSCNKEEITKNKENKQRRMKIAIGSDHAGYELKAHLAAWLEKNGYEVHDLGTGDAETRADYPEFGEAVGREVAEGKADKGIVVCGSGIGISIAANKVNGIRAALVHDPESAIMSRRHNDANVLALSGRPFSSEKAENAEKIAKAWLETAFDGGRHAVRVQMLSDIEKRQ